MRWSGWVREHTLNIRNASATSDASAADSRLNWKLERRRVSMAFRPPLAGCSVEAPAAGGRRPRFSTREITPPPTLPFSGFNERSERAILANPPGPIAPARILLSAERISNELQCALLGSISGPPIRDSGIDPTLEPSMQSSCCCPANEAAPLCCMKCASICRTHTCVMVPSRSMERRRTATPRVLSVRNSCSGSAKCEVRPAAVPGAGMVSLKAICSNSKDSTL
mmetsp:Transcript_167/g.352  ORF Transcript_167/g.352 Transcript_167/m.352 type:complete len:225 (-) Transcript_167:1756-2430(-)